MSCCISTISDRKTDLVLMQDHLVFVVLLVHLNFLLVLRLTIIRKYESKYSRVLVSGKNVITCTN